MTDERKQWVTIRVPESDREQAADYKPDGVTWGECLITGAEHLNENLASDPAQHVGSGLQTDVEITPTLDDDALADIREELIDATGDAVGLDPDALADALARRFDYAAVADATAERVVDALEGRR